MEGDAQSLLEIQLAEQQAETVCNTNKQHSICQNTVLCSLLQQLKTKLLPILILLLFGLSGLSAQDTAQTTPPQWSDPKIPTPFAQVLEERGQLDSVDYAFDRIAYYPWQGFAWHPPLIAPPKKPKTVLTTDVILADNIRETMVAN
ncbi:MAG: hypothetical protein HYX20_00755 [Candidatus Yanofskybacteria bacterium]|nr:hypothetical protein [Candidatus Yanofskybacteria bacterium]